MDRNGNYEINGASQLNNEHPTSYSMRKSIHNQSERKPQGVLNTEKDGLTFNSPKKMNIHELSQKTYLKQDSSQRQQPKSLDQLFFDQSLNKIKNSQHYCKNLVQDITQEYNDYRTFAEQELLISKKEVHSLTEDIIKLKENQEEYIRKHQSFEQEVRHAKAKCEEELQQKLLLIQVTDDLQKVNACLKEEKKQLEIQIKQLTNVYEDQLKKMQIQLVSMTQKVISLETERRDLQQKFINAKKGVHDMIISDLESQLKNIDMENSQLRNEVFDLKQSTAGINRVLCLNDIDLRTKQMLIESQNQKLANCESERILTDQKIETLTNCNYQFKNQNDFRIYQYIIEYQKVILNESQFNIEIEQLNYKNYILKEQLQSLKNQLQQMVLAQGTADAEKNELQIWRLDKLNIKNSFEKSKKGISQKSQAIDLLKQEPHCFKQSENNSTHNCFLSNLNNKIKDLVTPQKLRKENSTQDGNSPDFLDLKGLYANTHSKSQQQHMEQNSIMSLIKIEKTPNVEYERILKQNLQKEKQSLQEEIIHDGYQNENLQKNSRSSQKDSDLDLKGFHLNESVVAQFRSSLNQSLQKIDISLGDENEMDSLREQNNNKGRQQEKLSLFQNAKLLFESEQDTPPNKIQTNSLLLPKHVLSEYSLESPLRIKVCQTYPIHNHLSDFIFENKTEDNEHQGEEYQLEQMQCKEKPESNQTEILKQSESRGDIKSTPVLDDLLDNNEKMILRLQGNISRASLLARGSLLHILGSEIDKKKDMQNCKSMFSNQDSTSHLRQSEDLTFDDITNEQQEELNDHNQVIQILQDQNILNLPQDISCEDD